jgi:hypothetical protein
MLHNNWYRNFEEKKNSSLVYYTGNYHVLKKPKSKVSKNPKKVMLVGEYRVLDSF